MSEMVERVAAAIISELATLDVSVVLQMARELKAGHSGELTPFNLLARGAIAAMREPTEAMLKAKTPGRRYPDDPELWLEHPTRLDGALDQLNAKDVWQTMVDEALK